ncbi:response regulator [bacterium]|nr:response regulator [bacterium]
MNQIDNKIPGFVTGNERILLVDDEEIILDIGQEMLEHAGYNVITANDGEKALNIFDSEGEINLVILDLTLPGISGSAVLEKLLKINPSQKVIIVSGDDFSIHKDGLADKGARKFIQKPYQMQLLLDTVREVLDLKEDS